MSEIQAIKLSAQTKSLFVQIAMKVLLEQDNINELLDNLEFATDAENLLHCLNPPTVKVDWDTLEEVAEEGEDYLGLDEQVV